MMRPVKTLLGSFAKAATADKDNSTTRTTTASSTTERSSDTSIATMNSINITEKSTQTTQIILDNHKNDNVDNTNGAEVGETSKDEMFLRLKREAAEVAKREPFLCLLLSKVGLISPSQIPFSSTTNNNNNTTATSDFMMEQVSSTLATKTIEPAKTFEEVISRIVSHRLSTCSGGAENVCPKFLRRLIEDAFASEELELGHTMSTAVREDAMAVFRRDPACETLLEAVLFMKGFLSLVIHRAARRAWKPVVEDGGSSGGGEEKKEGGDANNDTQHISSREDGISVKGTRFVALLLQSQASSAFGVDIHPAASIGAGVMIDHATGVVIGETATVGDGTTILHGVTLGGTGKESGDRHPKVGKDVLIGAGTKILGNIRVGDRAKIGAGSVVLRAIPSGATAVGAPARIIGFTPKGERPGSSVDMSLMAEPLVPKSSSALSDSVAEDSKVEVVPSDKLSNGVPAKPKAVPSVIPEALEEGDGKVSLENGGDTAENTSDEGDNEEEKEIASNDEDEEDEDADGNDEDNDVTDFGTPAKCRWVKPKGHNDDICPFRDSFRRLPSLLSKECMSHTKLRTLLLQHGCTEDEIVEVFFELLHCVPASSPARQAGCIPLDIFSKCFVEIAVETTSLDLKTCEAIARGDVRTLEMSKKASRRFRSTFSKLGKITERALSSSAAPFLKDNSVTKAEQHETNLSEAIVI